MPFLPPGEVSIGRKEKWKKSFGSANTILASLADSYSVSEMLFRELGKMLGNFARLVLDWAWLICLIRHCFGSLGVGFQPSRLVSGLGSFGSELEGIGYDLFHCSGTWFVG